MPRTQMSFGEKLRELRKNAGKSQMEVVQEIERLFTSRIRISQTTLSTLEQRPTAPRGDILEVLAEYYGVPIADFFESQNEEDKREGVQRAKKYLESLKERKPLSEEIHLHTNENSSQDEDTRNSLDNLRLWQPEYGEDEYLDED